MIRTPNWKDIALNKQCGKGSGVMTRKYRAGWYLLFRKEGRDRVWLYEKLQNHEVQARIRQGWRIA